MHRRVALEQLGVGSCDVLKRILVLYIFLRLLFSLSVKNINFLHVLGCCGFGLLNAFFYYGGLNKQIVISDKWISLCFLQRNISSKLTIVSTFSLFNRSFNFVVIWERRLRTIFIHFNGLIIQAVKIVESILVNFLLYLCKPTRSSIVYPKRGVILEQRYNVKILHTFCALHFFKEFFF